MDCIDALSFSTFGGNPLSAASGLATIRAVLDEGMQQNAHEMGQRLVERLTPAVQGADWIAELRGAGLMQAIETVQPGSIQPDAPRSAALMEACRRRGLLIGKGGLYGNVLRITPMLNVTESEIDEGVDALVDAIAEVS